MTGTESGGSGMFAGRGQDVPLMMDDDDEDDGETGEPPALLPFSQLLFGASNVDDGRRTSAGRFNDEPAASVELLGEMTLGRTADEICF